MNKTQLDKITDANRERNKNGRDSNIELLRILVMLIIIAFHSILYSGIEKGILYTHEISVNTILIDFFGCGGAFGVDVFIIITSYFSCKSRSNKIELSKNLHIILQTWIMCVILCLSAIAIGIEIQPIEVIKQFITPAYGQYWFITSYICFVFILPFLNRFADAMSDSQSLLLVIVLTVIVNIYGFIFPAQTGSLGVFIYIYFVVNCLLRYPHRVREYRYHIFVGSWVINSALIIIIGRIGQLTGNSICFSVMNKLFRQDTNLLLVLMGISIFSIFLNFKLKYNPIFNKLASGVMGVYIFHENRLLNGSYNKQTAILWERVFHISELVEKDSFILSWIMIVIIVFIMGWILGWVCSFISRVIIKHVKLINKLCLLIEKGYDKAFASDNRQM